jgi:hypothetical protein
MLRCPFCHYDNEDGALFCEQCKSDLGGIEQPATAAPAEPAASPFGEAVPMAEAVVAEAVPIEATPVEATPIEAAPVEATPIEPGPADVPEAPPMAAPVPVTPEVVPPAPVFEQAPPPEAAAPPTAPAAPPAPGAAAPAAAPPTPPPQPASAAPAVAAGAIPANAQPRLLVLRGQKRNVEYPIYEGQNFIGRADEKPVDIDLEDQEPPDRVWSSRQHAVVTFEEGRITIEDLSSSNGTFVNRARIYPAQPQPLKPNDVIQIGTVQLKLIV